MKINLTEEKRIKLEAQHKMERDGRIRDRIKAVLLANEGWAYKQIAQALRTHYTTVFGHLCDYLQEEKLKPNNGGSISKLNDQQTQELIAHLEENIFPSTKEIIAYIFSEYEIIYTQQGIHDWLINHNFSYKKPSRIPLKYNEEKQKDFIDKYNDLKATCGPDDVITFMDSVHPTQETKVACGWIRKGVNKPIATVANRARINLTGAINLTTMAVVKRAYDTINLPHAVNREYLEKNYDIKLPSNKQKLTGKINNKLHEVLEKEPLLFENKVILEEQELTAEKLLNSLKKPPQHPKIVMHILPPYSPNLNPIERLWKVMNEQTRNNVVFESFSHFKEKIDEFFDEKWIKICDKFRTRINDNFQKLKPAF